LFDSLLEFPYKKIVRNTLEKIMAEVIEVDLPLHRLIEARRQSFDETRYQIVMRALGGDTSLSSKDGVPTINPSAEARPRHSRRGGTYKLVIFGKHVEAHSLKEVLKTAILLADEDRPGFIDKLAQHRTSRGRRIVARKAEEIYPGKPGLVANCAERLDNKWWFDTNISNAQCQRYLGILAQVGGFKEPKLMS
jgi:hypothetical protein